ncbi:sulfoxide reductase heme-binding subunit YedZ [bacterium]|nr:sulfoxide reductase heme-binding subunit YedZ [bacterium]
MKIFKSTVFTAALLPVAYLIFGLVGDKLGANPIETLLHKTGFWTLTFLMITLSVSPVRKLSNWNKIIKFRRMLGLFAFFYACLHFTIYLGLDRQFEWQEIVEDLSKRPYITIGFTALVMLVPLAITSTKGWIRKLGKRWQKLHRLIYVIATAGVVHFWWLVKKDITEPLIFALILSLLMTFRLALLKIKLQAIQK